MARGTLALALLTAGIASACSVLTDFDNLSAKSTGVHHPDGGGDSGHPEASAGDSGAQGSGGLPATGGRDAGSGGTSAGGTGGVQASGGAAVDGSAGAPPDGGTDGSTDAGVPASPPSCADLPATCGASADEDCCTSLPVTGGTFFRSYDGVTTGYLSQAYPATVSDFRLDKYEVTVGRFRKFIAAWSGGWRPSPGAGKHTHLNAGNGLSNSGAGGGFESGWIASWSDQFVSATGVDWDSNLTCDPAHETWTSAPGANENRPATCANWYEQYAFCIWDGGFLPSEAEWNYAAAGGAEQRVYPWSTPPTSTTIDATYAVYGTAATADVGSREPGNGRYGQADLGGNAWEWALDWYVSPLVAQCDDCAYLPATGTFRSNRSGNFYNAATYVLSSYRTGGDPTLRNAGLGSRCARAH